jgi:hypothetical protein
LTVRVTWASSPGASRSVRTCTTIPVRPWQPTPRMVTKRPRALARIPLSCLKSVERRMAIARALGWGGRPSTQARVSRWSPRWRR